MMFPIVADSGCFDVVLVDGKKRNFVELNRPYFGLCVVTEIWRELINFSSGSVCLVLASEKYQKDDYLREYVDFIKWKEL